MVDGSSPILVYIIILANDEIKIGKFTQCFDPHVLHCLIHKFNISVVPSQPSFPLGLADKLAASGINSSVLL